MPQRTFADLSGLGKLRVGELNHVAIAVPDLAKSIALYRDVLGADVSEPEDLPGT